MDSAPTIQRERRANASQIEAQLVFTKNLNQVISNIHDHVISKINTAYNFDEIMLGVSKDICTIFNADRLTIYSLDKDKATLISKIKTGANSFKDLKLRVTEQSLVGYVALQKKVLNITDVYDEKELASHSTNLRFLQDVDKRTGYRTKQALVVPILDPDSKDLAGVIQVLNNKADQPFSRMLVDGILELAQNLAVALRQSQQQPAAKTKYDHLVYDAVLSADELDLAVSTARRKNVDIEDELLDEFQVKPAALGKALALFFGVPYEPFNPDRTKPSELLKNLKREYVESSQWVPIDEVKEGLVILTTDPEWIQTSRVVNNVFSRSRLVYRVCSQREFNATLNLFFGGGGSGAGGMSGSLEMDGTSMDEMLTAMGGDEVELDEINQEEVSAAADNELVKLVNKIIMDAHRMGASDIHVEPAPGKGKTVIRLRKDGSLLPYIEVPSSFRSALVTRIKIMCDLDISEKRKPQDGKIKFNKYGPLDIELRVATIPSQGGMEDIVMRILATGEPIKLNELGLSARNLETLKAVISKPYGLFFVCGPTGSGKTTTLHSVLGHINKPETKIWTAEDPVEITQKGLRQVQINKKAGMDFATIMRAFLRADPDVIMVGEMRDKETVSIGIEASLTGHLVFATLHTNSAPESVVRLLDMGMDPFNFSDALLGVLAQRLAKRLCKKCKKSHTATQDELKSLLAEYATELMNCAPWKQDTNAAYKALYAEWVKLFADEMGRFTLYEPVGCEYCSGTGYRGRVGLHELMVGTDLIKKNIQEHARVAEMFANALNDGMRTLKQDGIEKVLSGITDMHQVRVVCMK
ncbi:GspE/PulE family protein [Candidatus Nitrotoga arctica]|uniref:Type II secretory pathway, ATPase PulE/Tfp pilus assembly pathway, ATPase PilB n=1 Tax=Candidatus Nitrotoga arctica TaxID=453162 RepID=A0ABN8AKX7_9PROT|nr:ATPase, T2SS/T4P/T4SS family [Candidatus Nitrotoga arctica]CAG9932237.1 Type II secretory pathway, ATPase PulE/Tfp pilus assembly pathway, ATPase PilB [Candidatus Nitrotoga arctica]